MTTPVDNYGPEAVIAAVNALTEESKADVTVSTAHKAKGREWPEVGIADEFPPPPDSDQEDDNGRPIPEPVSETDARLAYVAVTRARHCCSLFPQVRGHVYSLIKSSGRIRGESEL